MNDTEYTCLKTKIRTLADIDLDSYKGQQMRRRLEGFIGRADSSGVVPFCKRLVTDSDALRELRDSLTIT